MRHSIHSILLSLIHTVQMPSEINNDKRREYACRTCGLLIKGKLWHLDRHMASVHRGLPVVDRMLKLLTGDTADKDTIATTFVELASVKNLDLHQYADVIANRLGRKRSPSPSSPSSSISPNSDAELEANDRRPSKIPRTLQPKDPHPMSFKALAELASLALTGVIDEDWEHEKIHAKMVPPDHFILSR